MVQSRSTGGNAGCSASTRASPPGVVRSTWPRRGCGDRQVRLPWRRKCRTAGSHSSSGASRDGQERGGGGQTDDDKQGQETAGAAAGAEQDDHAEEGPGDEDRDLTEAQAEQEAAPVAGAEVVPDVLGHAGLPSCCGVVGRGWVLAMEGPCPVAGWFVLPLGAEASSAAGVGPVSALGDWPPSAGDAPGGGAAAHGAALLSTTGLAPAAGNLQLALSRHPAGPRAGGGGGG